MISVREAGDAAARFAQAALGGPWLESVRLEEAEIGMVKHRQVWLITLSAQDPDAFQLVIPSRRVYKTFTVDGTSGEVTSMKIRELASAQ